MKIECVVVGPLLENCYILSIDNQCLVIDPGDEWDKIKKALSDKKVLGILLTHRHFDHIGALTPLLEMSHAPIYEFNNLEEKMYDVEKFQFLPIFTPGHTHDSVSYYFPLEDVMFTGDFVFLESIGRTDLGGNFEDMKNSIEALKKMEKDIILYPGHDESTTLYHEKQYNPFF